MNVKDMREILKLEHGYEDSDLRDASGKYLKKSELEEILNSVQLLSSAEVVNNESDPKETEGLNSIAEMSPVHPEWTSYVLSQFHGDDLDHGNPRVDGLRRVAELVLDDEIVGHEVTVEQTPSPQNRYRATVKVRIVFNSGRVFESAADVSPDNMKEPFSFHPVASAETRAEGRALRKALKLNKVVTAEEMNGPDASEMTDRDSQDCTPDMIAGLRVMCQKDGLDLFKLATTIRMDIESVDELSRGEVKKITEIIHDYRNDPSKVPNNVKA